LSKLNNNSLTNSKGSELDIKRKSRSPQILYHTTLKAIDQNKTCS